MDCYEPQAYTMCRNPLNLERRVRIAQNYEKEDTDSDNELSQYVKSMEARLFGMTGKELRVLAYQLAEGIILKTLSAWKMV